MVEICSNSSDGIGSEHHLIHTNFHLAFRVCPHGDRRLYRLGIKVDYGGMDERYAMNKTIASRPNVPCSVIAALR